MVQNQIMTLLFRAFDNQREVATVRLKREFAVFMFAVKSRIYHRKKGPTQEIRNQNTLRESFIFAVSQMEDTQKSRAAQ